MALYVIADEDTLARWACPLDEFLSILSESPPRFLQIRAKNSPAAAQKRMLVQAIERLSSHGVSIVMNDAPELAAECGAEFVHVGQDDMHPAEIRRRFPGLKVGLSTHTASQVEEAMRLRPDYIAIGPVFSTVSKLNPEATVGVDFLPAVRSQSDGVPLVAIGGITPDNASLVCRHVDHVAVISALFQGPERDVALRIRARLKDFERILCEALT